MDDNQMSLLSAGSISLDSTFKPVSKNLDTILVICKFSLTLKYKFQPTQFLNILFGIHALISSPRMYTVQCTAYKPHGC
jgi:hypothetical protein